MDRDEICPAQVQQQSQCLIAFDVTVVCDASCFDIVSVQVDLLDINDNSPVFYRTSPAVEPLAAAGSPVLRVDVSESAAVGTRLPLSLLVHDADSAAFGVVDCRLFPVGLRSTFSVVRVRSTAATGVDDRVARYATSVELILREALDRELTDNYRLELVAVDGDNKTASCVVDINVVDENDNTPVFESSRYVVNVLENITAGCMSMLNNENRVVQKRLG